MEMQLRTLMSEGARLALVNLSKPWACARELDFDRWDFALRLLQLQKLGVGESYLRWLILDGYVDQADEVTTYRDPARRFQRRTILTFSERTCFVLTEAGALLVGRAGDEGQRDVSANSAEIISLCSQLPHWDRDRRVLYIGQQIVKRYSRPSPNQDLVLSAFEEEGWPSHVYDPLPHKDKGVAKKRLHDTIIWLNRNHEARLLRFRGDGSGEGICWERVAADTITISATTPKKLRLVA